MTDMDDRDHPRSRVWFNRESGTPWWAGLPDRLFRDEDDPDEAVEMPWRHSWEHLPKRSAGFGFSHSDYVAARRRAEEVARSTLGEKLWQDLHRDGYLELRSQRYPGITYRLRVGRRIEVRCDPGVTSPWRFPYLCINPAYPLPEVEFFAHLYLYVRDQEDEIIRVAAPQPWDQALGRTF